MARFIKTKLRAVDEPARLITRTDMPTEDDMPNREDILHRFADHPIPGAHLAKIRDLARDLALCIEAYVPYGREQSRAQAKVEEAVFWANAGIAREQ